MQIVVPATEPFVGLRGPDPGSELFRKRNPCTTVPFVNNHMLFPLPLTHQPLKLKFKFIG